LQKRPLVVAIYDSKWFMKTLEILKRRGVKFHHYYTESEVPYGSIVYTDLDSIVRELSERSDVLVVYDHQHTCRELEKAILSTMYITSFKTIALGIDPGKIISYIVLGDDVILLYGEGGLEDLSRDLDYVLNCIPFEEVKIKVGSGVHSIEVVEYVKTRYRDIPLELVDEYSTTPSKNRVDDTIYLSRRLKGLKPFRYKDIYAAYRIALSKGVEVK